LFSVFLSGEDKSVGEFQDFGPMVNKNNKMLIGSMFGIRLTFDFFSYQYYPQLDFCHSTG
jgi:hypothetical protein